MCCIFIQVCCKFGQIYEVVDKIYEKEVVFEFYFMSGDYDFIVKIYVLDGQDIGCYVNDIFVDILDVECMLIIIMFYVF